MPRAFDYSAGYVEDAKKIVHTVYDQVEFGDSMASIEALRLMLGHYGIKRLIWAHNNIVTELELGDDQFINPKDIAVLTFPRRREDFYKTFDRNMAVIQGWFMDPFYYDTRDAYRNAARQNLLKAKELLAATIEQLKDPAR